MSHRNHGIVITQTPFRISFFGGGTDFPEYFNAHGSTIIGTAIDKYLYVTVNSLERFFERRIRLSYSKLEFADHPDELEHSLVRCILNSRPYLSDKDFFDIHTYADLPASSGMGSSSTFTVGMLNALYLLNGVYKTPEHIAKEAIHVERVQLQEAGGWQDQIFAAFGGFNKITFANDHFRVEPICLTAQKKLALEQSCMMFFTGDTRSSADIQQSAIKLKGSQNEQEKFKFMQKIQMLANEAFDVMNKSATPTELVHELGKLLDIAWQAKRNLSHNVSNAKIDNMYETALKAGALGGKLCGAGGGGFLLLMVPQAKRQAVIEALSDYKQLDIKFEDHGSRVVYSKTCAPLVQLQREVVV
jgi:D-glycero-alpha-D-manno-heptose-7-phosphate kinase